ncbi:MAG: asparaginase [Candidatus Limnocylindrales bacterium]|nr:asparaginase [Candidatus Limnocylindrales bacterium]
MTAPASPAIPRARRPTRPSGRGRSVPPVLVRQVRNGIEESVHRGDIVEVDAAGRLIHQLGDPNRLVTLRSTVKPFGALAVIEAGGIAAFDLEPAEIAILASSHSGEDLHVRTLQGLYRRTGVSQAHLACGAEGMPLDALTAARLARDGEKPGPIRHMCSGQHTVSLLLSRLKGWDPTDYWKPSHPSQIAYRATVARAFGTTPAKLQTAIDGCGLETYAFPLHEVARAYAMLADPTAIPAGDRRSELAEGLLRVRDAMLAKPEMVGGRHDRLDTSLMKAVPNRLVSKAGMEALRGLAILRGPRNGTHTDGPSGMAIKIEDGDGYDRGTWAASVEALRQAGVLDGGALRELARYHRPVTLDPHGRAAAEAIPEFELAPVGELIG